MGIEVGSQVNMQTPSLTYILAYEDWLQHPELLYMTSDLIALRQEAIHELYRAYEASKATKIR